MVQELTLDESYGGRIFFSNNGFLARPHNHDIDVWHSPARRMSARQPTAMAPRPTRLPTSR